MHFIKSPDSSIGEVDLTEYLRRALFAEQKVLWLVSGGSNIPTTVTAMQQLAEAPLGNLTIALGDERYGQVGHQDSNEQQLTDSGFDPKDATFISVLKNEPLDNTVRDYSEAIVKAFGQADHIIGQFGMGVDGHISGVLPGSIAVSSDKPVVAYQGGGFTRITLTPPQLSQVATAYVFAFGEPKREQLVILRDKNLPLEKQPIQLLKNISNVYVYNDQIGDA